MTNLVQINYFVKMSKMLALYLAREENSAMDLLISVIPNASRTEIVGWKGDALKIRVAAPPVDGKANKELVQYLAKNLGVAKTEIEIVSGHMNKRKRLRLPLSSDELFERLKLS